MIVAAAPRPTARPLSHLDVDCVVCGRESHNSCMSELAERVNAVLARAAGSTVSTSVAALMTTAAVVLGKPDLAFWAVPTGAAVGSLTEEGAYLARRAWALRGERVNYFVEQAATQSGMTDDELMMDAAEDPMVIRLLSEAVEAAAESADEAKVRVLAGAFVRGAKDPALVDEMRLLIGVLRDLEVPEIRLLALLSRPNPRATDYSEQFMAWKGDDVSGADPGLGKTMFILRQRLAAAGLAHPESSGSDMLLTHVGRTCAHLLHEVGSTMGVGEELSAALAPIAP